MADSSPDGLPSDALSPDGQPSDAASQPGCLPGLLAATLLMGVIAALMCGVTTWILFQKRTELAIRTLDGHIPNIQQSRLDPDDKRDIVQQLEKLRNDMQREDYSPDEASASMQRLVRLPIPQWGELDAIESFIKSDFEDSARQDGIKQLSRMRRTVELNLATVVDINDVLIPVTAPDDSPMGRSLVQPLTSEMVQQVVERARILADRSEIPDQVFPTARMSDILRRELRAAQTEGGF